ncbi:MAG: ABC transporter ATP-binding protein [bacterium]
MCEPIVVLEDIEKFYSDRLVLSIPRLEIARGKLHALIGPNGAGKTTLLKVIGLLEAPDRGRILFDGRELSGPGDGLLKVRRRMSMIMQEPYLFHTTVFKNVAYGLWVRGWKRERIKERVAECLQSVGLEGFEGRRAWELSRGEAQRVALARAMAPMPELLLLDEPGANVDRENAGIIERLILKLGRDSKMTVIWTTHDLHQPQRIADSIVALWNGRTVPVSTLLECAKSEDAAPQLWPPHRDEK